MIGFRVPRWTRSGPGVHKMLLLSEILIQHHELESFADLEAAVQQRAGQGEMFFQIDVRPPFRDTPENWEARLENALTAGPGN